MLYTHTRTISFIKRKLENNKIWEMRGNTRYFSQECIDAYMTNNKRTIKDMANRDFHAQNQLSFGYSFAK